MGVDVKDIDFDELDRAVSSVLNQADQAAAVADPVVSAVVDEPVNNTQPADVGLDTNTSAESPSAEATEPVVEQPDLADVVPVIPALATKRRGKFMDVVHPSSDMAPETEHIQTSQVSVGPKIIAPITPIETADALTGSNPEAVNVATQTDTQQDEALPIAAESIPDSLPVEVDEPVEDAVLDDSALPSLDDAVQSLVSGQADMSTEPTTQEQDQQTPFLNDAKVEKRPLGAFGDDEVTEDSAPAPVTEPPLPTQRELQPDIVQVETVTDDAERGLDSSVLSATAPAETAPTVSSDDDASAHHLFDTASYHQPLAATPMKKKTPIWAWWVGGLTVCLAAGGAIGYLLFVGGF